MDAIVVYKTKYGSTKTYAEWMNKIKIAGNEEIKAELQRQIDEFLAKKK